MSMVINICYPIIIKITVFLSDEVKTDYLEGMKENVICGHLIPAGTGLREFSRIVVGDMEDYEKLNQKEGETAEEA